MVRQDEESGRRSGDGKEIKSILHVSMNSKGADGAHFEDKALLHAAQKPGHAGCSPVEPWMKFAAAAAACSRILSQSATLFLLNPLSVCYP
jgi:hypothetical protein